MSAESEELYSLLVPLTDDRLIVPRACVAEVVRFTRPKELPGSEDWMLGTIDWNGRELPVISFEGTMDKEVPASTGRTRVVVFHSLTGAMKSGFYGMITQGFPQLVRVNREVLRLEAKDGWPESAPILCRVKMINEYPLIPHLEKIEELIIHETAQA